jgi:serine/threonine-protein kinase RsbW
MALVAELLPNESLPLALIVEATDVRAGLARIMASRAAGSLAADRRATVEIVMAEVLNNIAEHAYAGQPGSITVTLQVTPARLTCQISDQGREMPDGKLPLGTLPVEAYPEGGFGWYLIRSLTTDLHYRRDNDRNLLRFAIPG